MHELLLLPLEMRFRAWWCCCIRCCVACDAASVVKSWAAIVFFALALGLFAQLCRLISTFFCPLAQLWRLAIELRNQTPLSFAHIFCASQVCMHAAAHAFAAAATPAAAAPVAPAAANDDTDDALVAIAPRAFVFYWSYR